MSDEARRQVRLTVALKLIGEAPEATDARTRTAYAVGYIDGLLDEGQLSVENAEGLKKTAMQRRDRRLEDLGAAPVPKPAQGEDWGRSRTADELTGMIWWNSLDDQQRRYWMAQAGNTGVAADAWLAYKRSCN
jgi:hypothetical protein